MSKSTFNYLYANGSNTYQFLKLPKVLFTDKRFAGLSNNAKILYGFLEDKISLSCKKKLWDSEGRLFVYFPMSTVQEYLGVSKGTACNLFKELEAANLVIRQKSGGGVHDKIYVADIFQTVKDDVASTAKDNTASCTKDSTANVAASCTRDDVTNSASSNTTSFAKDDVTSHSDYASFTADKTNNFTNYVSRCTSDDVASPTDYTSFAASCVASFTADSSVKSDVENYAENSFDVSQRFKNCTSRGSKIELQEVQNLDLMRSKNCTSPFLIDQTEHTRLSINQTPQSDNSRYFKTDVIDDIDKREVAVISEVKRQINYDYLQTLSTDNTDVSTLERIVEVMAEVYLHKKPMYCIGGASRTIKSVESELRRLRDEHVVYVLNSVESAANSRRISNIRSYLLACLYNAPHTMATTYNKTNYGAPQATMDSGFCNSSLPEDINELRKLAMFTD